MNIACNVKVIFSVFLSFEMRKVKHRNKFKFLKETCNDYVE